MRKLFFSADGRIGPEEFIKGAVILLAVNFVLWLAWFTNAWLPMIAGAISMVTIFCWGCLFSKRFHDANMNGMMFIPIFGLFLILVSFVVPLILYPLIPVSDRAIELAQQLEIVNEDPWAAMSRSNEENMAIMEMNRELFAERALPNAIIFFVSGAALAFGINKFLKTDPNPNRWG